MTHTCTKVTVRQREIRNNRISLYLDYYPAVRNPETMQMSRREYLGIYIYAHPKNEMEREFNNDMLNKAEAIRCIRVQSLINEEFGFLDKTKQKADFLAYFKKMCRNKDQKWQFVYQHFYNFVKGQCTFGDVNVDLCKKFREYLLNAKQLKHSNRPISLNSASGYYSTFRGLLKIAYRDKWFRENINDYLDKIEPQDVKKEYLTLDEVKQLAATPCDIPVLKAASLFACLTGLRISDILNLQTMMMVGLCVVVQGINILHVGSTIIIQKPDFLKTKAEKLEAAAAKAAEAHVAAKEAIKAVKEAKAEVRVIEATPEEVLDITVAPKPGTGENENAASDSTSDLAAAQTGR